MANTIQGLNNYYSAFISPIRNQNVQPISNLIYNNSTAKSISQSFTNRLQSNVSSYLSTLSSNTTDLKASVRTMAAKGPDSVFEKKAVTSSSTGVSGTAASNADIAEYTVNVKNLAEKQVNTGSDLSSAAAAENVGLNTISIASANGVQKNISFTVDSSDTNKSALDKMAKSINLAKAGVTANVVTDAKTGMSHIKLEGQLGANNSFTVKDVNGNSADLAKLNTTTTSAKDALVFVNGKQYTSADNTLKLNNNKVSLTLNKAEGTDVKLSVGNDTKSVKDSIINFAASYNKMIEFASSKTSQFSGAEKLEKELSNIVGNRKSSLEAIGITMNEDHTLSIDSKKLEKSISETPDKVESLFSGNSSISEKMYNEANKIMSSPIQYSKPSNIANDFNTFYNYMTANSKSAASMNVYSGMILDALR